MGEEYMERFQKQMKELDDLDKKLHKEIEERGAIKERLNQSEHKLSYAQAIWSIYNKIAMVYEKLCTLAHYFALSDTIYCNNFWYIENNILRKYVHIRNYLHNTFNKIRENKNEAI